jgi:hypothetical protein
MSPEFNCQNMAKTKAVNVAARVTAVNQLAAPLAAFSATA